jgi:hypothetical protein
MSDNVFDYVARLERVLGPSTFPLAEDKVPMAGYSWPEVVAKVPLEIRWGKIYKDRPAALVTSKLCCLDFDWHDDKNTVPYYDHLLEHEPRALAGLYVERSKHNGVHAVGWQNPWMQARAKQYMYPVIISGKKLEVEVKIGPHYFVTYPTPGYTPISDTLADMLEAGTLATMQEHWNVDVAAEKREIKERLSRPRLRAHGEATGDVDQVNEQGYEEFLAEQWLDKYRGGTGRHNGAGMLAKQLSASGCSKTMVKNIIEKYWRRIKTREPRKGEIEEAVDGCDDIAGFTKTGNGWILTRWKKSKK